MPVRLNIEQTANAQFMALWKEEDATGLPEGLRPFENTKDFVEHYGITIKGKPFDWWLYRYLVEIYLDEHPELVLQCGAQVGKSVYVMARMLRESIKRWGSMFGYYFPTFDLPRYFSSEIFKPFVKSSRELSGWLGRTQKKEQGTNQVLSRTFGASTFFFLSTRGVTSTEGLPMGGVFLDEVRRMERSQVLRVEKRSSAQRSPINIKVSTAKYPGQDINGYFLQSDQRYWHTGCSCPDGIVLALTFPDCIMDLGAATPEMRAKALDAFEDAGVEMQLPEHVDKYAPACFRCPKCGDIITDVLDGYWEAHNPGAYVHGYQIPQLLLHTYDASRAWAEWNDPNSDAQVLWNDMLGLPYVPPDAQPVQEEHLAACVELTLGWPGQQTAKWRRTHLRNCSMGVDVQRGYLIVVIKQRQENGKFRTMHLQVAHRRGGKPGDQWKQLGRLMFEYDVQFCVIDAQPEYEAALSFAQSFKGRVWLCHYGESETARMVSWHDRRKKPADQKQGEASFKFMVTVQRTKCLEWSLNRWVRRQNVVPNPASLLQRLPVQAGKVHLSANLAAGQLGPVAICRDLYFPHQMGVIFVKHFTSDENERDGIFVMRAEHLAGSPDFAHANLYADVACARSSARHAGS